MPDYQELHHAREVMRRQSDLYQPSAFWDHASSEISQELRAHGVERFRRLPLPLSYFVPTYGEPGGGFSSETAGQLRAAIEGSEAGEAKKARLALDQFLEGRMSALSDYRVLLAADDPARLPHLHTFSESDVGSPVEQFDFGGRKFSRSSLNYLLGLAVLKKHLGDDVPRIVLEVGGGFGTLGEVLSSAGIAGLKYIDIDIPPTSFVAQYYLSEVLGRQSVATFADTEAKPIIEIESLPAAAVLCSWQIERLQGNVDLFVNFISFQEMEPPIVKNYLGHVDRLQTRWILLRNMREGKQVRTANSVGVECPIFGDDYPAMLPNYEVVERNIFPFGFQTVDGFNSEIILLRRKGR